MQIALTCLEDINHDKTILAFCELSLTSFTRGHLNHFKSHKTKQVGRALNRCYSLKDKSLA